MSDILLAKPVLPPGFIDLSVGEPHVVRETLNKLFGLTSYELSHADHMFEYPSPKGYKPLVKLLEEKHQAPIIVTNGAKQALGACFYALQQMGKLSVGMRTPYWALIPPLVRMHGLEPLTSYVGASANLLLLPNNPDGFISRADLLQGFSDNCRDRGVPLIHDAAYYTPIYLPDGFPTPTLGDVQIYSISKMLGLSGLRLGYVACPNHEFYKFVQQYMEAMTVGVSILSQMFLFDLLTQMNGHPETTKDFEKWSANKLIASKKHFKQVNPEVLEVDPNLEQTAGMFGWFKVGPKADFNKSKVNMIDGALFGTPGYVRVNLAFDIDIIEEIVDRLNSVV